MTSETIEGDTTKGPEHRPLVGPLLGRWKDPDPEGILELAAVYPGVAAKVIDVFQALEDAGMPPIVYEDYPLTFPMMQEIAGIDTLEGQSEACRDLVERLMTTLTPPVSK